MAVCVLIDARNVMSQRDTAFLYEAVRGSSFRLADVPISLVIKIKLHY